MIISNLMFKQRRRVNHAWTIQLELVFGLEFLESLVVPSTLAL